MFTESEDKSLIVCVCVGDAHFSFHGQSYENKNSRRSTRSM